jgi:hypothetical protein
MGAVSESLQGCELAPCRAPPLLRLLPDATEKGLGVFLLWVKQHLLRCTFLYDRTLIHKHNAVRASRGYPISG